MLYKLDRVCDSPYCDTPTELEEYDLTNIESLVPYDAVYWYSTGGYEGNGQIILKVKGRYILHDMGHCSCYGPLDHINTKAKGYGSLTELLACLSDEYSTDVKDLVEFARLKGL